MRRILAVAMVGSLAMAACGRGDLAVTTPTDTSSATSATSAASAYAVGGMVQSIEKPTRGVSGALIEITQGANAGKSSVSDDTGSFAIFGLAPGMAVVRVSKNGFDAWTSKAFDLQADTKIAVELFPTPPTNSSGAAASGRCNDGSWTWATILANACVNNGGLAYGVCPGALCKSGM